MSKQLFVRAPGDGIWQWRLYDSDEGWQGMQYFSGDISALLAALPAPTTPVFLILPGQSCIATSIHFDVDQKKHAAKLIPYELEDDIIATVDSIDFSFQILPENRADVVYARSESWLPYLNALLERGCDVIAVLPDFLLLEHGPDDGHTLLLEEGRLLLRSGENSGLCIEKELLDALLPRLYPSASALPARLRVFAATDNQIEGLLKALPDSDSTQVESASAGFWDLISPAKAAIEMNFRRGKHARRLPLERWWKHWKRPVYAAAAAFVMAAIVNLGLYWQAKSEQSEILEQMQAVYLKAVPNGRLGDPEGVLTSMLRGSNTVASEPSNFISLLNRVSQALAKQSNAELSNYSYNVEQRAMQLTLEFAALGDIGTFRAALEQLGIEAESPRTTSTGGKYQARMKVMELQR